MFCIKLSYNLGKIIIFCLKDVSVGVANKTIRIKEKIRKFENKLELK